jgi:hypothetical protein
MNRRARAALTGGGTSVILTRVPQRYASHLQTYQFGKIESERRGHW